MYLQDLDMPIDRFDQPRVPHQPMHGADAATRQSAHAVTVLVLDVTRAVHRRRLRRPRPGLQPLLDPLFATRQFLMSTCAHSKCPPVAERSGLGTVKLCYEVRHFELFVYTPSRKRACTGARNASLFSAFHPS